MKSFLKILLNFAIIASMLIISFTYPKVFAIDNSADNKSNLTNSTDIKSISFTSTIDSTSQTPGGKIKFKIYSQSNFDDNISAFRFYLNFDNSRLSYEGVKVSDVMDNGRFKLREENGSIISIFLENKQGLKAEKDKLISLFELNFSIHEDITYDSTCIEAYVDSALDSNCENINISNSLNQKIIIYSTLPENTSLKSLSPSSGILTPDFDSNITSYGVDVDSSVDSITFDAVPVDSESDVKINRKTLGKQDSITQINITVTSKDKSTSTVYSVNVNRLPKEIPTEAASTSSSKSATAKTASSNSSKSATSSSKSTSSSSKNSSNNQQSYNINSSSDKSNKNPYTEIGHNLIMKKNSFDIFLMFILMCICIFVAVILLKKNSFNKK